MKITMLNKYLNTQQQLNYFSIEDNKINEFYFNNLEIISVFNVYTHATHMNKKENPKSPFHSFLLCIINEERDCV